MAKLKQPATAMAHPRTLAGGKDSPEVNKYNATKMTTLLRVFPTAVGTGPRAPRTFILVFEKS